MPDKRAAFVLSAHAADFAWRCGGAIALRQNPGYEVAVACLSYGERSESAKPWKQGNAGIEGIKAAHDTAPWETCDS